MATTTLTRDPMTTASDAPLPLEPLIFTLGKPGRRAIRFPVLDVPEAPLPTGFLRADDPADTLQWPEVTELEVVRHFVHMSQFNKAIDVCFYPLGSCTMKYNPKVNESVTAFPGFAGIHPYQPEESVQGALAIMYEMQQTLAEISGFDTVTLCPAAGAHGELTGILLVRAYHESRGENAQRRVVLVPDSAHGTNPATAAMAGYRVVTVKSDARGNVDVAALRGLVGPDTAALMMTNPNTLGLFDEHVREVIDIVHEAGGLVYNDGANFNAILGIVRPGDIGFDVMHYNLHKTFSSPHGGGGPGAGPVGVKAALIPFLPAPYVVKEGETYHLTTPEHSIGKLHGFHGNWGVILRAYTYIRANGPDGLRAVSESAVLNANYLLSQLRDHYAVAYDRPCMHEFVITDARQRPAVRTLDIAKRLIDYGFHPMTVYFPLVVEGAMLVEPTETETKETLDAFIAAMRIIAREAAESPEIVTSAPHTAPLTRLDEATAARRPNLRWLPVAAATASGSPLAAR